MTAYDLPPPPVLQKEAFFLSLMIYPKMRVTAYDLPPFFLNSCFFLFFPFFAKLRGKLLLGKAHGLEPRKHAKLKLVTVKVKVEKLLFSTPPWWRAVQSLPPPREISFS